MVNNNVRFEFVVKKPFVGCRPGARGTLAIADDAGSNAWIIRLHERGMCTTGSSGRSAGSPSIGSKDTTTSANRQIIRMTLARSR
jgi:hypothetical protein